MLKFFLLCVLLYHSISCASDPFASEERRNEALDLQPNLNHNAENGGDEASPSSRKKRKQPLSPIRGAVHVAADNIHENVDQPRNVNRVRLVLPVPSSAAIQAASAPYASGAPFLENEGNVSSSSEGGLNNKPYHFLYNPRGIRKHPVSPIADAASVGENGIHENADQSRSQYKRVRAPSAASLFNLNEEDEAELYRIVDARDMQQRIASSQGGLQQDRAQQAGDVERAQPMVPQIVVHPLLAVSRPPLLPAAPANHLGNGIVGVFVPPAIPKNPWEIMARNIRASIHANAFPFAATHANGDINVNANILLHNVLNMKVPFLCQIQNAWLRYWKNVLCQNQNISQSQRENPLESFIPSFGWVELGRFSRSDKSCGMCGNPIIHRVVAVKNPYAPIGYRILYVGTQCAVFMQKNQQHVRQNAWDNEKPLP